MTARAKDAGWQTLHFHRLRGVERNWCQGVAHQGQVVRTAHWQVFIFGRKAAKLCPTCRKTWQATWDGAKDDALAVGPELVAA